VQAIQRHAVFLRSLGAAATIALPFLLALAGLDIPSEDAWNDGTDPFALGTVFIACISLGYGAVNVFDEPRREIRRRTEAEKMETLQGIEAVCRRAFVPINEHFSNVPVSKIGVHLWRVRPDGVELERVYKFTMEHQRPETGLRWVEGRGAIGRAWSTREVQIVTSFGELVRDARATSAETFDSRPADERCGLSRAEVLQAPQYEAILAVPLTGTVRPGGPPRVVGVFSVDFKVDVDPDVLQQLLQRPEFQDILGSCENYVRTLAEKRQAGERSI